MTVHETPSPRMYMLLAIGLGVIGGAMLGHGLGIIDLAWLHPNPKTPQWVFGLLGAFLLLAALICLGQFLGLAAKYINVVFYVLLFVAMVLANWLVFFADGASCRASGGNIIFWFSGLLCQTVAGAFVLLFDLIFALVILSSAWKKLR